LITFATSTPPIVILSDRLAAAIIEDDLRFPLYFLLPDDVGFEPFLILFVLGLELKGELNDIIDMDMVPAYPLELQVSRYINQARRVDDSHWDTFSESSNIDLQSDKQRFPS
jgi:hypothetical protein